MKNTNRPLVVVFSCKKNYEKQALIREYFKNKLDFIIVQGGNTETCFYDNLLNLNVSDSYEHLHLKVIEAFKFIHKNTKKSILKIDDDSFLDIKVFNKYNFDFDYGGFFNEGSSDNYTYHADKVDDKRYCTPINDSLSYNFALGGGYFLSRKALKFFCQNYKKIDESSFHLKFKKGREDRIVAKTLLLFSDKLKIINDGYWIRYDDILFSSFNSSVFHPITLEKYKILMKKRNPLFYV